MSQIIKLSIIVLPLFHREADDVTGEGGREGGTFCTPAPPSELQVAPVIVLFITPAVKSHKNHKRG